MASSLKGQNKGKELAEENQLLMAKKDDWLGRRAIARLKISERGPGQAGHAVCIPKLRNTTVQYFYNVENKNLDCGNYKSVVLTW